MTRTPCPFCGDVTDFKSATGRHLRWRCGTLRILGNPDRFTRSALCRARQQVQELAVENAALRGRLGEP